ncbi:hypothetical protein CRE_07238 [Caenorhabditis remanei]|uniref:DUF38 domain-containing protein n=1 Tax=Caenorhabditis remanei TaxID=31234 RepID=E3M218_CAERE|nr:hypothetical protein CRE_07238 [Caenorhabditis remanei]
MALGKEIPPTWHNLLRAICLEKYTLSSAHRIILSMFPTVTLEEVQAFHAIEHQSEAQQNGSNLPHSTSQQPTLKTGSEIDSTEQETKKDSCSLLNVPEVPMKQILSGINYTDQKHLRRTCKVVQPFLDEQVNVHETIGLHLILDDVKRCFKGARANGEREPKKKKLESDEQYPWIDEAVELFQRSINKPNLKVKSVYITHELSKEEPTEDQRKYFYQRIQEVFQGMKTKLNAERVELTVESPDFLLSILTKLQEGTLTELTFNQYPELMPVFDMKDIVVLPQWSGLRYLNTHAKLRARVADFKHIPFVIASFEAITIDEIKDLRNHTFNDQKFRWFSLSADFNKEEVEDAMQPFTLVKSGKYIEGRFLRADNKSLDFFLWDNQIRITV